MRKKLFTLFLALIACAGTMLADIVQIGDLYYYLSANNKTALVTYQVSHSETNYSYLTAVNIPESVKYNSVTYTVTDIGESAFMYCKGLTSVTIPNSVKYIGHNAFELCTNLTSITIPNSVTGIGSTAFKNCSGLTSITIPNSVTSIGESAFMYCEGLTSIEIPNSVTYIGDHAFSGCSGLTSITIPNSVTSIKDLAFYGCSGLTSITIPNSVTSIGYGAFKYCSGLTSITIGNSVTSIGETAFSHCSSLTSVTNYATTPQTIHSDDFYKVNLSSCTLYVPKGSINLYQAAAGWKGFNILPIEGTTPTPDPKPIEAITVRLDPQSCSSWSTVRLYYWGYTEGDGLSVSWPGIVLSQDADGWYSYTFDESVDKVNIIWTDGTNQTIDITNVEESTCYSLNSTSGKKITFSIVDCPSLGTQINHVSIDRKEIKYKVLRDGQVVILRGDKTYTLQGQEVK